MTEVWRAQFILKKLICPFSCCDVGANGEDAFPSVSVSVNPSVTMLFKKNPLSLSLYSLLSLSLSLSFFLFYLIHLIKGR